MMDDGGRPKGEEGEGRRGVLMQEIKLRLVGQTLVWCIRVQCRWAGNADLWPCIDWQWRWGGGNPSPRHQSDHLPFHNRFDLRTRASTLLAGLVRELAHVWCKLGRGGKEVG